MSATLGSRFIAGVREMFAPLFERFGFQEVGAEDNLNFAAITVKNRTHFLRMSCDFRDSFIDVAFGKLVEDLVPPVPIAPPRTGSEVREIPGAIIVWLATGDKARAFNLSEYTTAESLDIALGGLAKALATHGGRLFAGDQREWDRAAELTVTREWRP